MTGFIEKERQAYANLLEITEKMLLLVQNHDYEAIPALAVCRDEIACQIAAIDEKLTASQPAEINELLELVKRIAGLNKLLELIVTERLHGVGEEIAKLNKGAEAAAQYEKMGAL